MKTLLALAAIGEAIAGLLVLVYPPLVVKLLLGAEISGAGVVMSLIALGSPAGRATLPPRRSAAC